MPLQFLRFSRFSALVGLAFLAACGGGGGRVNGGGGGGGNGGGGGGSTITVSGRITFDRITFRATQGQGLNPTAPVEAPAREVVVEAIEASSTAILASSTTNATGDYSLTVPANRNVFIRAKAQMLKTGTAPTWNFSVLNNTGSDALYALDGSSFNTGASNVTRNLHAPSGWGTTNYTSTRAAAPFAILDSVYRAKQLLLSASPTTAFPALSLFWSPDNRAAADAFCPDDGDIGTSFYVGDGADDACAVAAALPAGIYILGDFADGNGDTDEFDTHVIAHEFGHYFEDRFSRSDSIGGQHSANDRLDLRVAFGEGWGNAYAGMALNDPLYRDSFGGVGQDFSFNVESDASGGGGFPEGWYSELSVAEILWDIFDDNGGAPESGDAVALGFTPLYSVMTTSQTTTEALTSIFSFATALRSANASAAAAIGTLLTSESISGSDAFGAGESNVGTDPTVVPIYQSISLNTPVTNVCSRSTAGSRLPPPNGTGLDANKLGNRRFLRFENNQTRLVTIQATGATTVPNSVAATDPDIYVHRRGAVVAFGESGDPGQETTAQTQLTAGTYIIEVYDFDVSGTNQPPRCMTVTISGS